MTDTDDILARIFDYLKPMTPPEVTLDEHTDLAGTLGLESVTVINMVLELEDEYDVSVPLHLLVDIRTPAELAALVDRLRGED